MQATSGSAVSAEAVSLGLIVTELVINALKHGFQGEGEGEILVSYDAQDSGWRLSVSDNGSDAQEESGETPYTGLGYEHRRGAGASTQRHGPEDERTSWHHGDYYGTSSQR